MKCCQCGRPAMFLIGPEQNLPLCLDCNYKLTQMFQQQNEMYERMINFLSDAISATVGLPPISPRFPAKKPIYMTGGLTLNNITIDRSRIGVLNTGTIKSVDVAVNALRDSGNQELSRTIQMFTEAVITNTEIQNEAKNDIMEILSFISTEATKPQENRRLKAMKLLLEQLAKYVSLSYGLSQLWDKLGPVIKNAF